MKWKFFDRLLLAILLIVMIALSLALVLIAAGFITGDMAYNTVDFMYNGKTETIVILAGAGVLLLLIAIRLMFAGRGAKPLPTTALIRSTEIGTSFISLSALETMVLRHCGLNTNIKSTVCGIKSLGGTEGVLLSLRLALMPDTDIPALIAELQTSLKAYIENTAGITVKEIGILIDNLDSPVRTVS
ncbi:MAG: hypothetical protein PHO41_01220 [Eubacteriales bacterium]|nr:hypothetical protein [Eubacteriales bacterium]